MEAQNYYDTKDIKGLSDIFCPGDVDIRPPANSEYLRLYNNPLCPFAERARLALAAKDFEFQTANINLNDKPKFFVEEGGNVPILEKTDGSLISSSDLIIDFVKAQVGGVDLIPTSEDNKKEQQEFIDQFDSANFVTFMFKGLILGDEDNIQILLSHMAKIDEELSKNNEGNKFLNNQSEITLADILFSPPLIRASFIISESLRFKSASTLSMGKYPHLTKYLEDIHSHPKLKDHITPKLGWLNYVLSRNSNPEYKLPYPLDLTPLDDSQGKDTLFVLDGNTAKPRTNENYTRIFGHSLCPFVERARIAFAAK